MIEYKTMKINPSDLNSVLNVRACFGWELGSQQEINTKDSHLERHGDKIYSVTESENYTNITLKRDDRMPNRNRLVTLEKTYDDAVAGKRYYSNKDWDIKKKLSYFKIIIYSVLAAILFACLSTGLAVLGVGVAVGLFFLRKKLSTKSSNLAGAFSQQAKDTLSEARSLIR